MNRRTRADHQIRLKKMLTLPVQSAKIGRLSDRTWSSLQRERMQRRWASGLTAIIDCLIAAAILAAIACAFVAKFRGSHAVLQ